MNLQRFRRLSPIAAVVLLGFAAAVPGASGAQPLEPRPPVIKPERTDPLPEWYEQDFIIVKFHDDLPIRLREADLVDLGFEAGLTRTNRLSGVDQMLAAQRPGGWWTRFTSVEEEQLDADRQIAQQNLGRDIADLNTYFFYHLQPGDDPAAAIDAFNAFDVVELAQAVPIGQPPLAPNFQPDQGYLNAATVGIDAYFGWEKLGTRGAGIRMANVEWNFNVNHLDLPSVNILGNPLPPPADDGNTHHGTATMGVLFSKDNDWGTTGICHQAIPFFGGANPHWIDSMSLATSLFSAGDVILIEVHIPGPNFENWDTQFGAVPVEWWKPAYDVIVTAVGKGISFIVPAGNGQQNLDDPVYSTGNGGHWPFTAAQNSGSIMVGGGAAPPGAPFFGSDVARSRMWFSNWGSRLNVQGWGERVATTGYGNAYSAGGFNLLYTRTYAGTSSASPIVAGAVVLLQAKAKQQNGVPLSPAAVRTALAATGSPQQSGNFPASQKIGPLPDVAAAASWLGLLYGSCSGKCGGQSDGTCYCDAACFTFGDCCADVCNYCAVGDCSCAGHCGSQAPSGCWCDEDCVTFGDCCLDACDECFACVTGACCAYFGLFGEPQWGCAELPEDLCALLDAEGAHATYHGDFTVCANFVCGANTCLGHCGSQAPPAGSGCWCDSACFGFGDCCDDVCDFCDHGGCSSCVGNCGGQAPSGCWCDNGCIGFGDCCDDACEACDQCPTIPAACCHQIGGGAWGCSEMTVDEGSESVCANIGGIFHPGVECSSVDCTAYSCAGSCGGVAPSGCWCDSACFGFGDCCTDVCMHCTHAACTSCAGNCGTFAPGGCWCDTLCFEIGDCCADVCATCSGFSECPHCPADLSGPAGAPDGIVDVFDLIQLINNWGPCGGFPCAGDLSGPLGLPDKSVDVFDLIQLINNWGPCPAPSVCDTGYACMDGPVESCPGAEEHCWCYTGYTGEVVCAYSQFCDLVDTCYDGNCPPGTVCVINSCCNEPVCLPACGSGTLAAPIDELDQPHKATATRPAVVPPQLQP